MFRPRRMKSVKLGRQAIFHFAAGVKFGDGPMSFRGREIQFPYSGKSRSPLASIYDRLPFYIEARIQDHLAPCRFANCLE